MQSIPCSIEFHKATTMIEVLYHVLYSWWVYLQKQLNRFKFVFHHVLRCTKKIIEKHPATHDIVMSDGGVCMMRPNNGYKGDD